MASSRASEADVPHSVIGAAAESNPESSASSAANVRFGADGLMFPTAPRTGRIELQLLLHTLKQFRDIAGRLLAELTKNCAAELAKSCAENRPEQLLCRADCLRWVIVKRRANTTHMGLKFATSSTEAAWTTSSSATTSPAKSWA